MNKLLFKASLMSLGTAILLSMSGCSGGGGSSGSSDTSTTYSGIGIDGILVDSTVCIDVNKNDACDTDEPSDITDAQGKFSIDSSLTGPLLLVGGTDLSTNAPFVGSLKAPAGSSVVSPLTSAVQALIENGSSAADAQTTVKSALGLDGLSADLTNFDPFEGVNDANSTTAQEAQQILAQQTKLQVLVHTVSAAVAGADENNSIKSTMTYAFDSIVKNFDGGAVDLNESVVGSVIEDVADTLYADDKVSRLAAKAVADSSAELAVNAADRAEETIQNAETPAASTDELDKAIKNVNEEIGQDVEQNAQDVEEAVQTAEDNNESLEDAADTKADEQAITTNKNLIDSIVIQIEEDANATRNIADTYPGADANATTAEDALLDAQNIQSEVANEDANLTFVQTKKAAVEGLADVASEALSDARDIKAAAIAEEAAKAQRIALLVDSVNAIDANATADLTAAQATATQVAADIQEALNIAAQYSEAESKANDANTTGNEAAAAYTDAQAAAADINASKADVLNAQTAADETAAQTALSDAQAAKTTFDTQLALAYTKADELAALLVEIRAIRDEVIANQGLVFTSDDVSGNTFYDEEFTTVVFTDTTVQFQEMNPKATEAPIPYSIDANGHLIVGGQTTVTLMEDTTDYLVIRVEDEPTQKLYKTEAALLATLPTFEGTEISVSDDSNDSTDASQRAGNELISLSTRVENESLVITVTAEGDIDAALSSTPYDVNYSNVVSIDINRYFEFGIEDGNVWFHENLYEDGNFTDGTAVNTADYSYDLSGSTLTFKMKLSLMQNQDELLVSAEMASDLHGGADEENDQVVYDKVILTAKWDSTFTWPTDSTFDLQSIIVGKTLYTIEEGQSASITFDVDGTFNGVDQYGAWDDNELYEVSGEVLTLHVNNTDEGTYDEVFTYQSTRSDGGIEFSANIDGAAQDNIVVYLTEEDRDAALHSQDATPVDFGDGDLTGTVVYEVYFDENGSKSIGQFEFVNATDVNATGIEGEDAGDSFASTYSVSENEITIVGAGTTSFYTPNEAKPYFMIGYWVSTDGNDTDVNYYFNSQSDAEAFTDPNAPVNDSFDAATYFSGTKYFKDEDGTSGYRTFDKDNGSYTGEIDSTPIFGGFIISNSSEMQIINNGGQQNQEIIVFTHTGTAGSGQQFDIDAQNGSETGPTYMFDTAAERDAYTF